MTDQEDSCDVTLQIVVSRYELFLRSKPSKFEKSNLKRSTDRRLRVNFKGKCFSTESRRHQFND